MRPAVRNFTEALDRVVVHFLLYHDSIRHSSRNCAEQIYNDSTNKLIDNTELGYDCLKELVTFLRRSSIQSDAEVNIKSAAIQCYKLVNLIQKCNWQLSPSAQHTIDRTFGDCIKNFEEVAEKQLENAWPSIKYCSYQEIRMNSVDLDPTGITAKIRENQNNNDNK